MSAAPFVCPPQHQAALETVKNAVGIRHHYLDSWVYLFLANKKYDVKETIAKLERRDTMERTVFAKYTMTPSLKASMRSGIVQYIGRDKEGRPVLYFNTARDSPTSDQRPERQSNLDMFLSWAVRCDPLSPTSTVTWLINQKDASMMRNVDLIFQKDMALRISKFFPGVVARMYICNMSSALTFVMKPLLRQLPSSISDCIFLFSAGDLRSGKLLEHIDAAVLPIAMGGQSEIDSRANYELFAETIEEYFDRCIAALRKGVSIKQMEMMEVYGVDKDGQMPTRSSVLHVKEEVKSPAMIPAVLSTSVPAAHDPAQVDAARRLESPLATTASSVSSAQRHSESMMHSDDETLDMAVVQPVVLPQRSTTIVVEHQKERSVVVSAVQSGRIRRPLPRSASFAVSPVSQGASTSMNVLFFPCDSGVPAPGDASAAVGELPELHLERIHRLVGVEPAGKDEAEAAADASNRWRLWPREDDVTKDAEQFRSSCAEVASPLRRLMVEMRDGLLNEDRQAQLVHHAPTIKRLARQVLVLYPPTSQPLHFPLLSWLSSVARGNRRRRSGESLAIDTVCLDCTSPDNLLLSAQAAVMEYVDECGSVLDNEEIRERVLRRLPATWERGMSFSAALERLRQTRRQAWRQVSSQLQAYISTKVAMSVSEFIRRYELLVEGGKIDVTSNWYRDLFSGVVQYREVHRKNWLFYVYPPLSRRDDDVVDEPPTVAEMLASTGRMVSLGDFCSYLLQVDGSLQSTRELLASSAPSVSIANPGTVERYLEDTKAKMYIPYESQQHGITPARLFQEQRECAVCYLDAVAPPLREFLYASAAQFAMENALSDVPNRDAAIRLVRAETHRCIRDRAELQRCKQIAASCAVTGYELQVGSGGSGNPSSPNTSRPPLVSPASTTPPLFPLSDVEGGGGAGSAPDGYAFAIELIFVVAYVCQPTAEGGGGLGIAGGGGAPLPPAPAAGGNGGTVSSVTNDSFGALSASSMGTPVGSMVDSRVDLAALLGVLLRLEALGAKLVTAQKGREERPNRRISRRF